MANYEQMSIGNDNEPKTTKARNEQIDSVKYWLIVLVIAGHVFERMPNIYMHDVLMNWIFIFHMPLFIFISGYFSKKKDIKNFKASIWKLAEPLLLFQMIAIIFIIRPLTIINILTPWWVLWYLLSLIYWRLIIQLIPNNILRHKILILSLTIFISAISGFLPFNRFLSIQRTLSFMPFFFLGYYMKEISILISNKYRLISFIFLALSFLIPLYLSDYLGDTMQADPYETKYGLFSRFLVLILSIPMSLAFMNICIKTHWIANQGRLTMQYYIFHAFIIPILLMISKNLHFSESLIMAIIYTIVITIGIGIASRLPYFTKFTNPSSFFKK